MTRRSSAGTPGSRTRLIEGEFPNYRNLIPASSYPNVLTVGKEALLEALRRVKIMAQRTHRAGAAHASAATR